LVDYEIVEFKVCDFLFEGLDHYDYANAFVPSTTSDSGFYIDEKMS
jgi:hypothetical protein